MTTLTPEKTITQQEHQTYLNTLKTLSDASVNRHFNAFTDIEWENPEYAVNHDDDRWILPPVDVVGRHPWYQNLPREEQIRIGLLRQANIAKVGLQFEQILISGIMCYTMRLPNGSPEFRYTTHEATEECHHTQMFQEFVNRTGTHVKGGPWYFRTLAPILPLSARWMPYGFFIGVLAGEEPIDHVQKSVLRAAGDMNRPTHPLLQRIMQIHVAEEARHIGFAHQYLEHTAGRLTRTEKIAMAFLFPILMRLLGDIIMKPSRYMRKEMGMPRKVAKEIWWNSPESTVLLSDMFSDVRMLATKSHMMNPVSRVLWKLLKIDGRTSRYRSEPAPASR